MLHCFVPTQCDTTVWLQFATAYNVWHIRCIAGLAIQVSTVEYWHRILWETVEAWQGGAEENSPQQNGQAEGNGQRLRQCLEALKEVGSLYMPLKLMAKSGIMDTVDKLKAHPNSSIARYSTYITLQWRSQMLARCRVLLDPQILTEPVGQLDEALLTNALVPTGLRLRPWDRRLEGCLESGAKEDVDKVAKVQGSEEGRTMSDTKTQSANTTEIVNDCRQADTGNPQQQLEDSRKGGWKPVSLEIIDEAEVEGKDLDGTVEESREETAGEGDVSHQGCPSDVVMGWEGTDSGSSMAGSQALEALDSPQADCLSDGTLPETGDGGQVRIARGWQRQHDRHDGLKRTAPDDVHARDGTEHRGRRGELDLASPPGQGSMPTPQKKTFQRMSNGEAVLARLAERER